ncbi:MAG: hypothetical protein JRN37_09285 [Nitrososphaerota archaeon]|nr:hypothetical protein [Nitrososphaerota archaeon]
MDGGDKRNSNDIRHMFVGLDLHKNYIQAAVVDDNGKLLKEKRIPKGDSY